MSKNLLYECLECDTKYILPELDGRACFVCDGYLNAVREVKPGEFVGVQRELIGKKVSIDEKLQYLDRLIEIYQTDANPSMADTINRITNVCDSIEKDLGIGAIPAFVKGGIVSTDNIMLLGDKDKETIIPLSDAVKYGAVGGTIKVNGTINVAGHTVTGMYKREWSGRCSICHQEHGHTIHCHATEDKPKRPDGVDGL